MKQEKEEEAPRRRQIVDKETIVIKPMASIILVNVHEFVINLRNILNL